MFSTLYAQGAPAQQPDMGYSTSLVILAIFAIFYFIMMRPNIKRQKEMDKKRKALVKGDKVVTSGGILATVEKVKDENIIQVKIADGVIVDVVLSTIIEIVESKASKEEADAKKKK